MANAARMPSSRKRNSAPSSGAAIGLSFPHRAAPLHAFGERRRHERVRANFPGIKLASQPPFCQHQHAIAHLHDFRQFGGNQEDRLTLGGQLANNPVNLRLGAHVHTAGRLVQNQDLRLRFEPTPKHQLLLIAAGKRVDRLFGCIELHLKLPDHACCDIPLSAAGDQSKPSHLPQCRSGQVALAGVRRKDCFIQAVLG